MRQRLSGSERLFGVPAGTPGASVLDFWQWAFSLLQENTTRGVFAEWLVGTLLGAASQVRVGWDAFDVLTPQGWKVEVKCGAYQQAWHAPGAESAQITFGPLLSRTWSPEAGAAKERTYNADVYVFCLQMSHYPQPFDSLDLTQWEFYVAPVAVVRKHAYRSIGLKSLAKIAVRCSADGLRQAVSEAVSGAAAGAESETSVETG